ncbi:MAG: GNAT family N-acetyltransferase [Flavobacteriaceae bacterium]
MTKTPYLFQSKRLGFRNWKKADLEEFANLNADPEVMEHFPKLLTKNEVKELIEQLRDHFSLKGYTYFVTELLETKEFIGMIGLAFQEYKSDFTPAVDIGWRLKRNAWGKGYATEGAKRCLRYAFRGLGLQKIVSVCTVKNVQSENVMKKIGMTKKGVFNHPECIHLPKYRKHFWYEINNESFKDHWI